MKKKLLMITILFLAIGAFFTTFAFVIGAKPDDIVKVIIIDDKYTQQEEYVISNEIKNLNLDTTDRSYVIEKSNKNYSYIEYFLYESEENTVIKKDDNGELNFEIKNKAFLLFTTGFATKKVRTVKVYLLDDAINNLDVETSSGSIEIKNIVGIKNLDVSVDSGSTKLNNMTVNELTIDSTSGSINLENIRANKIQTKVDSGSTKMTHVKSEDLKTTSTSGSVYLTSNEIMNHEIVVISGSVKIKEARTDVGFDIKTTSGSIRIYGEKRKEVKDKLEIYPIKYQIKVTSGSVKVEK
ncbi:Conserved hypothetical protein [Alteracholeplasma palmae J233]|uniref:DUF4097 domain-containing protein n=1 Tax=Alteracholeplasma palmae (strain ATCC 49389 / J233) TaxID=1318466 RepID=U4KNF9_ALTPJ|nr:DUF4097 family beta strand repeat-containing protein [Alteracholeplasma palmae]CCV63720.1 Conserved hypothetical protein [Alteracholeplasma palmae J233]